MGQRICRRTRSNPRRPESLDAILLSDPAAAGESRDSEYVRVLVHKPLTISYRINAGEGRVRVFSVNVYLPRK